MIKDPLTTIIIPNFNGKKYLQKCLDSIRNQTFQNFGVILVDNGSSDGSVSFVKRHYPEMDLIEFSRNQGFSRAINSGVRQAHGKYICLLNNDIELHPDFLKEIVGVLETERHIDYCAAKMLNFYARDQIDGAGDGVFRAGAGYKRGSLEKDSQRYDKQMIVFGACAGAALYRRSFFGTVGLFDEDFFAYLEDVDINMRANRLGLKCLYVPSAKVYHIGSATTGSIFNPFTVSLSTKNLFNVVIKNYPAILLIHILPSLLLYHLFWFALVFVNKQAHGYFKGLFKAVSDFPKMQRKRRKMLARQVVSHQNFLDKIRKSEKEVMEMILRRSRSRKARVVKLVEFYMRLFC